MPEEPAAFDSFAIVELMGHVRIVGRTREVMLAGHGLLRIDVPAADQVGEWTTYVNPSNLYRLTPCDEATARRAAARNEAPAYLLQIPEPSSPVRCIRCGEGARLKSSGRGLLTCMYCDTEMKVILADGNVDDQTASPLGYRPISTFESDEIGDDRGALDEPDDDEDDDEPLALAAIPEPGADR